MKRTVRPVNFVSVALSLPSSLETSEASSECRFAPSFFSAAIALSTSFARLDAAAEAADASCCRFPTSSLRAT